MMKNIILEINSKKSNSLIVILFFLLALQSCSDYLDVVPDNVATIDKAFTLRSEAEKYLFTCYSYLPKNGDPAFNIGMLAGDEIWIPNENKSFTSYAFNIATGSQRSFDTYIDVWQGNYQGAGPADLYPLFDGIRACNIFIENLEDTKKVPDINQSERLEWIAEVKFLKAYYHYYLMRMYGPIPIMRNNVSIDAPQSELYVSREPIEDIVTYVVELLDESIKNLTPIITDPVNNKGRITKSIASALKAEVLLTAASPLFNGNADMVGFNTASGKPFFNAVYSNEKWQLAADAAKEAINEAESNGHKLYKFTNNTYEISDTTRNHLSINQALSDRESSEVIWANTNSTTNTLQLRCMVPLNSSVQDYLANKSMAAPLKIASLFYTKNGVPINEDKTLDFSKINQMRLATEDEKFNIFKGYETARLNFDREPRFYADLGFDGSIFYLESSQSNDTKEHIEAKYEQYSGNQDNIHYNVTGYYLKKLISYKYGIEKNSYYSYAWPEIRLSELYLDYAEALNEAKGPQEDVFVYLDKIRTRAGIKGVKESWTDFSNNPSKFTTKEGLRQIIRQERNIELAFEGKRYWDLRRWKTATIELNKPILGWGYLGKDNASYYQVQTIFQQRFSTPRDYFWPINQYTILQNPNLIQNPGW
ncbi:MAG: RagB/SusD family nutrient uptake outer membrane protein [Flavobacterium sp.]